MSELEIKMLRELVVGLAESQALIIQHLIKTGALEKQCVINSFDFMASDFKKRAPHSSLSIPMAYIRDRLGEELPDFPPPPISPVEPHLKPKYPEWFKGIIPGGKP
jgi:hypothetical protein